ncbi:hypothetical protein A2856_02135 [Candidatus Uhrbacteria bacterium RIFCSPHIGHO2_01_FULL_63_20]|uniref:Uncharacterized protein n=1 Tax=Candidatus Uhrbacteria bacterium RIFCSPHIGHO2_01_FULL_63_20 TaxID=1802385 RepID=A0A1F7TLH4_9BACT|nr:MAG: hypothetical protein A2856_02135 [Candidatus Uhrbacteria bacterium RIFCSPHIGHO2_01_FULL_63_20]
MTFRGYLAVMALASVAAWLSWIIVLVAIDPSAAGPIGFVFFYLTLSAALVGTLATALSGIRAWARSEELPSRHVSRSLRQAILVAALVLVALLLLPKGLLTWWTAVLLVLFFSILELAFVSAQKGRG